MNTSQTHTKLYLLFFIVILIWGLSWPINKIGLQYITPIWFAAYRLAIGTISMFVGLLLMRKLIVPRREDLRMIFVIGMLRGLFMMLICLGLDAVEAGRAAILAYTTPIWVTLIATLFLGERSSILKFFSVCLGGVGIIVLFSPWSMDWTNGKAIIASGMLLLAALCWAISILCARYMSWTRTPLELAPWQLLVGTIPIVFIAFFESSQATIYWDQKVIAALLYTGVLATAFAYWGTLVISKELPPITASLNLLGIPVCGLIFSAWILHEPITVTTIIAMLLILCSLSCPLFEKK